MSYDFSKMFSCAKARIAKPEGNKMKDEPPTLKYVTILQSEYDSLLEDSCFLDAPRSIGVDNWDGYDDAIDIYQNQE